MTMFTISPIPPTLIHGAVELEHTEAGVLPHRLPVWARAQCRDAQLAMAQSQPSGVRLAFRTTASMVELVTLPTKRRYRAMAPRPDGVVDLLVDGVLLQQASAASGTILHIDMVSGATTVEPGTPQTLRFADLPEGDKMVELWLPHDETTELVALHADAPIAPLPRAGKRRWLHHGSSISQGSNATHPTGIWPAVAAGRAGVDLLNLGFGGSALLDPFTARTIRDLEADLISLKIGINLVNLDLMRLRAFGPAVHGFLDTIREGHPSTPLLVISPVFCPIHENNPGPTLVDGKSLAKGQLRFRTTGTEAEVRQGKLTLAVIRAQLEQIVRERAQHDAAIHYLDGRELYGEQDNARLPLPDELHPDAEAHRLIGERFHDKVFAGGVFGARGGVHAPPA
ncbi:GDSL-type esterase/lipase family protein [Massilia sp. G4R7]|uniref:GDSL-type esterase/lipase family protein n=1 Tax=Massilia phyllostachyos TaxID=2898585 RepID=A0ABS8Q8Q0_9BURK|nr:GDSL-type esterase/lipase family protein [Massilia phyllostachyos]MCD2518134.1 GDSL-type esterase/lipase family protein [Massilia phyllostachyos]